jgi:4-amino-4-deoxy-L-arabinose transferase-like glycosyltransferase
VPVDSPSGHPTGRGVHPLVSLLLLSALTFLLGLGAPAITDADEAYYAETAREMVESGDWLSPRYNYTDRWQKPILYYWLTAATYTVAGTAEWTARLWSALSGVGLVLLTWGIARRSGSPFRTDHAWIAAAIVATCFGYYALARAALPDLPLAFCITLGIWAALRAASRPGRDSSTAPRSAKVEAPRLGWWALAGLGAGLGFLMKGPVGLVVPGLVLLPIWWRQRRNVHLPVAGLAIAALVFAVVGLPWYVAMWLEYGNRYLESFFVGDNLERFTTERFNERRIPGYYIGILLAGLLPWSGYLLALAPSALRDRWTGARTTTDEDWQLWIWAAAPLLFYSVSVGQQPRYILPILPPLAVLLARAMARRLDAVADVGRGPGSGPVMARDLVVGTWFTVALLALSALVLARAQPMLITVSPWATWGAVYVVWASAALVAWIAWTKRWPSLPSGLAIAAATLMLAAQYGVVSGRRPEPVERMATLVARNRTADQPVASYQVFVRNLTFYTHVRQADLFDERLAVDYLKSPQPVLLVVRASDLPRLEQLAGVKTTRLGEVTYLDTARIRLRTLLRPDPSTYVERVLLVTTR